MTSLPRTFARRLLVAAARLSPSATRPWANAMAAELDAIEGDWAALGWATSGTGALLRQAIREVRVSRRALIIGVAVAALIAIVHQRGPISETRPVPGQLGAAGSPTRIQEASR